MEKIETVRMPSNLALDRVAETAFGSAAQSAGTDTSASSNFASLVQQSLAKVDATQNQATSLTHQYQLGQNDVSLEDAMISMQKANITFQTTVQVRNKLVVAYNDIMNMQL